MLNGYEKLLVMCIESRVFFLQKLTQNKRITTLVSNCYAQEEKKKISL